MQNLFFSAAQKRHRQMQLEQLTNLKRAEIILSIATLIQIILQIVDYEYYYGRDNSIGKVRDTEHPNVTLPMRIIITLISAVQIACVLYTYQKQYEMSMEISFTKSNEDQNLQFKKIDMFQPLQFERLFSTLLTKMKQNLLNEFFELDPCPIYSSESTCLANFDETYSQKFSNSRQHSAA